MVRCGDISTETGRAGPPQRRRWLGRGIRLVAAVLLGFIVLRSQIGARYRVISDSLAPTLVSDGPAGPDDVWVDKTAFWFRDPEPLELVVLRSELDPLPIVKRLIAIGPATVRLADGDVFVRRQGRARLERLQKDPDRDRGLVRARWQVGDADPPFAPGAFDAGTLRLRTGEAIRTEGQWVVRDPVVTTSFVQDFGASFTLDWPDGIEALVVTLDHGGRRSSVRFARSGEVRHEGSRTSVPGPERPRSLRLIHLDGRLLASADSVQLSIQDPIEPVGGPRLPGDPPYAAIEWVAEGTDGALLELSDLALLTDVHWPPEQRSFELAAGELFVLGDNPPESRDSRARRGSPFRRRDLLGGVSHRLRAGSLERP